jgi:hypothetical protein
MLFVTAWSSAGCGSTPVDRHAAYGRIQIQEARIARASHALELTEGEGGEEVASERAERCDELCEASRAIDAEATLLLEADARTRAERAARSCAACGASR